MKILGVDIGSSSIKIAEVEGSGRGVAITQIWELGLSLDPTRDPSLEVIEKLREFVASYNANVAARASLKDVKWIVAVPQNAVSVRLKHFPFQQRAKILKSLPFELEEEIPFDTDDTIFDARIIELFATGSDVLAVASPKEPIRDAIDRAKDGGFEAETVSAEGFALSNILDSWWASPVSQASLQAEESRAATAVLQIGHLRSILIVYRNGHPVAIRSIQWGGHDVALAIESVFKVPYIEAIKVLKTKSFVLLNTNGATRDQIAMHKAIVDSTSSLIRELRLSLLDFKTSAGSDVREVRLTGGASQIQNFAAWLTQSLEVPVNSLEYFETLASSGKVQINVALTPQLESIAGTAIGLALEGMRKPSNPAINLRKGIFAAANESVRLFLDRWTRTAQIAASIFAVFLVYAMIRESMTLSLAERSDEALLNAAKTTAGLKGALANADGVSRYISTESKLIHNRETLARLENFIPALDFVLKMAERLPVQLPPKEGRGLNVDRLWIENDELIVEGRALGADILASVERELQLLAKPGTLKKITASHVRKEPGTAFGFSMKINRKP